MNNGALYYSPAAHMRCQKAWHYSCQSNDCVRDDEAKSPTEPRLFLIPQLTDDGRDARWSFMPVPATAYSWYF